MNKHPESGREGDGGTTRIDVRGLVCPEPVVRTRQMLEQAALGVTVVVVTDSPESRDNIIRFVERAGHRATTRADETGTYLVEVVKAGPRPAAESAATPASADRGPVVLITSDRLGRGNDELGRLLMTLFLRTATELPAGPQALALVNGGVRLALAGSEVLPVLQELARSDVCVLVCGTCLDFFGEKQNVRVGTVSNMYELAELLLGSARVLTL